MANHRRISPERKAQFLAALRLTLSVKKAARAVGACRPSPYVWRRWDDAFATAWDEAVARGAEEAEAKAIGSRPGAQTGPETECSAGTVDLREVKTRLLMCLLKAHRPQRYSAGHGRRHEETQKNGGSGDAIALRARGHPAGD